MVPKGFLKEARFKNGPFAMQEADAPTKLIKLSTEAHPLSETYPYAEPPAQQGSPADSEVAEVPAATQEPSSPTLMSHGSPPVDWQRHQELSRRNPIRTADLNCQHFKYPTKPTWGFGSSGLGFRFNPGTTFSKKPLIAPHERLRGFRELRDAVPTKSEKEYQAALEHALAEAAAAAAAAAAAEPPAPEPSPAVTSKRKSDVGAAPIADKKASESNAESAAAAPPAADAPSELVKDPALEAVEQAA
jgi:hypothetical protein